MANTSVKGVGVCRCLGILVHTERNFMGSELSCQLMYTKYVTSIKLFVYSDANGDNSRLLITTADELPDFTELLTTSGFSCNSFPTCLG